MQVSLLVAPDGWALGLCRDCAAHVKILGVKLIDEGRSVAHFVDVTSEATEAAELRRSVRSSRDVVDTDLADVGSKRVMGVVTSRGCKVCTELMEADSVSFISAAVTEKDCSMAYKLFLTREGVPRLLHNLSKARIDYKLREISSARSRVKLTERQWSVLKSAWELGLYDYPRRITNDELAARIGVGSGTLSEILKRAEKKVIGSYFDSQS